MQSTSLNYRDEVESFALNAKYSGILPGNVYCGFDNITGISGLTFKINHQVTGQLFPDINTEVGPRLGVWMTNQGVTVKEDTEISLAISTNVGNSRSRIDLLIGRHNHDILTEGGIPATYEVIKGPVESSSEPSIPSPETATILGRLIMPADTALLTNMVWDRNRTPVPGGQIPALLSGINRFTDQQQEAQGNNLQVSLSTYELDNRGTLKGLIKGNTFLVIAGNSFLDLIEDKPTGTEINLYFQSETNLRGFGDQLVGGIDGSGVRAGYTQSMRPIVISNNLVSVLQILPNQIVTLRKVSLGTSWVGGNSQAVIYGDFWKVISVSDAPQRIINLESALDETNDSIDTLEEELEALKVVVSQINPPRSLKFIDFSPVPADYEVEFDSTGKARSTSLYYGYAECNGQNGTPNLSGKRMVARDQSTADANPYKLPGNTGGNRFVNILKANLPNVKLTFEYLWKNIRGTNESNNIGTIGSIAPNSEGGEAYNRTAETTPLGSGEGLNVESPYYVVLTLMWIGIPSS